MLNILQDPDTLFTSITGAYLAAAAAVWIKGANLGNLRSSQFAAINGIASKHEGKELVEVIKQITEEDPRLLMPPKRNMLFAYISISVVAFALPAIFHKSLRREYPNLEQILSGAIAFYLGLVAFGFYIMYNEYRYLVAIDNGKKQFEVNGGKTMRVSSSVIRNN